MSIQKRNGSNDLINKLNDAGWYAFAPVTTKRPTPDAVAANGDMTLAIVAESTDRRVAEFDAERLNAAELCASAYNAVKIAAVRFDRSDATGKWRFVNVVYLDDDDGQPRKTLSLSTIAEKMPMSTEDLQTLHGGPLHGDR